MHCEAMAMVFKTLVLEANLDKSILRPKVEAIIRQAVKNEFAFIDLVFAEGELENLSAKEVKDYMMWIANLRFNQLGFEGKLYDIGDSIPLSWLPGLLNAPEHANFFETRATDYAKNATTGEFNDSAYDF
jgi:ribonucleoside-diphosphate reductase beta chain